MGNLKKVGNVASLQSVHPEADPGFTKGGVARFFLIVELGSPPKGGQGSGPSRLDTV